MGTLELEPQQKQLEFLSCPADVAIYGGGAGGGKSWSLLVEPTRHLQVKKFGAVIFRRELAQIKNQGGLWDEATEIYPGMGGKSNQSALNFTFPKKTRINFAGLQYDKDIRKWQGSQIAMLGFDELTHFSEYQFFYLFSRNRTMSGVNPYIRATTNPDADSWVADFLGWWINQVTGQAIPERSGKIRWLYRANEKSYWANSYGELAMQFPEIAAKFGRHAFKTVSFIPADVFDNQILLKNDPGYLANLLALPLVERERLLNANWKIKPSAGKIFNREWFEIIQSVGRGGIDIRFWDFAATAKKTAGHDPDFTATIKMRYFPSENLWVVIDSFQLQANPSRVMKLFFQTAELDRIQAKRDGSTYILRWEIEPGSASKRESYRLTSELKGINAKGVLPEGDKIGRAGAWAVQCEHGNVKLLSANWNSELLAHLHGQPDLPHDDLLDAGSGCFNESVTIQDRVMGF